MSRLVENVNLDDLYRRTREIKENRIKIYQNILQRTHKKIKYTSRQKHNDHFCFYIVPEFFLYLDSFVSRNIMLPRNKEEIRMGIFNNESIGCELFNEVRLYMLRYRK